MVGTLTRAPRRPPPGRGTARQGSRPACPRRARARRRGPAGPGPGGHRAGPPPATQQLLLEHERAADAETLGDLLPRLGLLVARGADPLPQVQRQGLHATPPTVGDRFTLPPRCVYSHLKTALA